MTRQARNQALFREVNERIAELSTRMEAEASTQSFVCECSRTGCADIINVSLETYSRVRGDPTLFLLVTGHQDPGHEVVIEDLGPYVIAQTKAGAASQVAIATA